MHTLKYITSLLFCFVLSFGFAQKETTKETQSDSVVYKKPYGIRLGIDISKPILSNFNDSYKGFEIVGDFRVTRKWYIATELGYDEKIVSEDFTKSTTKGQFIKLGGNFNTYNNWLDMNNEIYVGGRYGFSIANHTLNSYKINSGNFFITDDIVSDKKFERTLSHWAEFHLGIKVETFKNLFVGFHGSYKIGLKIEEPKDFKTLYAPGFNRVYASKTGFGFNYTISYLIPIVNK